MEITIFEKIFEQYSTKIYRYCLMYLKNHHDAQDCTQNTFLKLYQNKKNHEAIHLKNWLYTVARNECFMYLRRNKKVFALDASILDCIEGKSERYHYEIISTIPEKYREILYLYYYEGYSQKEIAAILSISLDAVKKRMVRGRQKLEGKLRSEENGTKSI